MKKEILDQVAEVLWAIWECKCKKGEIQIFFEEVIADDSIWEDLAKMRHEMENGTFVPGQEPC